MGSLLVESGQIVASRGDVLLDNGFADAVEAMDGSLVSRGAALEAQSTARG